MQLKFTAHLRNVDISKKEPHTNGTKPQPELTQSARRPQIFMKHGVLQDGNLSITLSNYYMSASNTYVQNVCRQIFCNIVHCENLKRNSVLMNEIAREPRP